MPRAAVARASQPTIQITTTAPPVEPEPKEEQRTEEKPPRWFFDRIAEIPTTDWGRVWSLELHRREPSVPGQPGTKGYLTMFLEPVTYAMIEERFGGGKFRLNLCKNGRWETSHDFDIYGQPKFDLTRERPNGAAPTNGNVSGTDSKLLDMLQKQFDRMDQRLSEMETARGATNEGKDRTIELMTEGAKAAVQIVKDQAPQAKSASGEMREFVGALKEMGIIGNSTPPPPQKTLVEQITEIFTHPLIGPKLLELFSPKNPLDELVKLKGVKELLDGLGGGGGGGAKGDWKTALVEEGVPAVRDLAVALADRRKAEVEVARERRAHAEAQERTALTAKELNEQRLRVAANGGGGGTQMTPTNHGSAQEPNPASRPSPPAMTCSTFRVVPMGGESVAQPVAAADVPHDAIVVNEDEYLKGVKMRFVALLGDVKNSSEMIADFLRGAWPASMEYLTKYSSQQVSAFFATDPIVGRVVGTPAWNDWLEDAQDYLIGLAKAEAEAKAEEELAAAGKPN